MAALLPSVLAAWAFGCGHESPTVPTDPNRQVTPIETSGPVRITFVRASVPPGSTISGCGPTVAGCAGRLTISLLLSPPADGPVLYVRVYLHSMRNLQACLYGQAPPFEVRAGQAVAVDVVLDQFDACGVPDTFATMDAVVGGPIQIESRQAWSIRYTLSP
jgi:hypothetical protein